MVNKVDVVYSVAVAVGGERNKETCVVLGFVYRVRTLLQVLWLIFTKG